MKIVLVSGFLNHHQKPLSEAIRKRSDEFWFIATECVKNVGYQKSDTESYVLNYYDETQKEEIERIITDAHVVIFGSCPTRLVKLRMESNKLSFIYSERYFKKGLWRRFIPSVRNAINQRIVSYSGSNLYVLCASAFLPYDLSMLGYPYNKCYKWGYFPTVKQYPNFDEIINTKEKKSILWCARLIPLKHPEHVVKMALRLKKSGYSFELNMLGDGPMMDSLQKMICRLGLSDCVHLRGSVSSDEVRVYMERSKIFVFTSNRMEGWGAVMNESMNSACAVAASHAVGSVPFLIQDGVNGLVYRSGSVRTLAKKVAYLLDDEKATCIIGSTAYQTLVGEWNAEIAAERLIDISSHILQGDTTYAYESGPCSRAEIVKDNWYKRS